MRFQCLSWMDFNTGNMEWRVSLLFLSLLCAGWACDARLLGDLSVMQIFGHKQEEDHALDQVSQNDNLCTLCEEYATKAVDYFAENKTQTEVMNMLHKACGRVPSFKQQCITLVDYYGPLFFMEMSTVKPAEFCHKFNLCQKMTIISSQLREDGCGLCHHAVSEVLAKLQDPDSKLEIIELLLKGCNSMEKYAQKCKRMVFEYGPLILTNAEQFLKTTDVCTVLHACPTPPAGSIEEEANPVKVLVDS